MLLLTLSVAILLIQPGVIGAAINYIAARDIVSVGWAIGIFVLCAALHHLLSHKEGGERESFLGLNMCRLDERITELLLAKPLGQHERHGSSLNYASIDKGKWKASGLMDIVTFQGMPAAIMCVLSLVGLWCISPLFGLLATLFACLFYVWSLWLNYKVGSNMYPVERKFRQINRKRVECWEKVQRVTTSGTAQTETRVMNDAMQDNMAKDRVFWMWFIGQFNLRAFLLQRLLAAVAMAYGAYMVYVGAWEVGYLFPLLMWADTLNSNLLLLSHVERQIGRDIVPVQLMIEALEIKPSFDVYAGTPLKRNGPLTVHFDNLSYSYTDERGKDHPVLSKISLAIQPGEKVALIGPSGAGKTTLMKLLLRYDDPTVGAVRINGLPLKDLDLVTYMRQVGCIPQSPVIFDNTIGENLLYGVTPEYREQLLANDATELWELMRSLKIDFGSRLDRGIHTFVGRHGLKLSGGQAQRVMIGAAVAKKPRLMVIDEATSNLDSTTEREVQEGLAAALSQGITALVVTHRLSTVRTLCNRFVVLRPIEDVQDGETQVEAMASSFEELASVSPTFRQLACDQGVTLN